MIRQTGTISLEDLKNEFGGTDPIGLSDYYRGGALVDVDAKRNATAEQAVRDGLQIDGLIPDSGEVSLAHYYGSAAKIQMDDIFNDTDLTATRTTDGIQSTVLIFDYDGVFPRWRLMSNGVQVKGSTFRDPKTSTFSIKVVKNSGDDPSVEHIVLGDWTTLSADNPISFSLTTGNNSSKGSNLSIEMRYDARLDHTHSLTFDLGAINTFIPTESWVTLPFSRTYTKADRGDLKLSYRFYTSGTEQRFQTLRDDVVWEDFLIADMGTGNMEVQWVTTSGTFDGNTGGPTEGLTAWHDFPTDWKLDVEADSGTTDAVSITMGLRQKNLTSNNRTVNITITAQSTFIEPIDFETLPADGKTYERTVDLAGLQSNTLEFRENGATIEWRLFDESVQTDWVSLGNFAGNLQYHTTTVEGTNRIGDLDWTDVTVGGGIDSVCGTELLSAESSGSTTVLVQLRQTNKTTNHVSFEIGLSCDNIFIEPLTIENLPGDTNADIVALTPETQVLTCKMWLDTDNSVKQSIVFNGTTVSTQTMIADVLHHGAEVNITAGDGVTLSGGLVSGEWRDISLGLVSFSLSMLATANLNDVESHDIGISVRQRDKTSVVVTETSTFSITNLVPQVIWNPNVIADNFQTPIVGRRVPNAPDIAGGPWKYHPTLFTGTDAAKLDASNLNEVASCFLEFYKVGDLNIIRINRLNPPTNAQPALLNGPLQSTRDFDDSFIGVGAVEVRVSKLYGEDPEALNMTVGDWFEITNELTVDDVWGAHRYNHVVGFQTNETKEGIFRVEFRDKTRGNIRLTKDVTLRADFDSTFDWSDAGKDYAGNWLSIHDTQPYVELRMAGPNDNRISIRPHLQGDDPEWIDRSIGQRPANGLLFVVKEVTNIHGGTTAIVDENGDAIEVGRLYPVAYDTSARSYPAISWTNIALDPSAPGNSLVHVDVEVLPASDITLVNSDVKHRFQLYLEKRGASVGAYTINQLPNEAMTKPDIGDIEARLRLYGDGTALKYEYLLNGVVTNSGDLSVDGEFTKFRLSDLDTNATFVGNELLDQWNVVEDGSEVIVGINVAESSTGYVELRMEHQPTVNATGGLNYVFRLDATSTYIPDAVLTNPGDFTIETVGATDDASPVDSTLVFTASNANGYFVGGHKIADYSDVSDIEVSVTVTSGAFHHTSFFPGSFGTFYPWNEGLSDINGFGSVVNFIEEASVSTTQETVAQVDIRQVGRPTNAISFNVTVRAVSGYVPAGTFNPLPSQFSQSFASDAADHYNLVLAYNSSERTIQIHYVQNSTGDVVLARDLLIGVDENDIQYKAIRGTVSSGDAATITVPDATDWTDGTTGDIIAASPNAEAHQTASAVWNLEFRQKNRPTISLAPVNFRLTAINTFIPTVDFSGILSLYQATGVRTSPGITYAFTQLRRVGTVWSLRLNYFNGVASAHQDFTLFDDRNEPVDVYVTKLSGQNWVFQSGPFNRVNQWYRLSGTPGTQVKVNEGDSVVMQSYIQFRQANKTSNTSTRFLFRINQSSTYIPTVSWSMEPINTNYSSRNSVTLNTLFRINRGYISWKWNIRLGGGTTYERGGDTWDGNVGDEEMEFKFVPTNLWGTNYFSDWTTLSNSNSWTTGWFISPRNNGNKYAIGTLYVRQKRKPTNQQSTSVNQKRRKY